MVYQLSSKRKLYTVKRFKSWHFKGYHTSPITYIKQAWWTNANLIASNNYSKSCRELESLVKQKHKKHQKLLHPTHLNSTDSLTWFWRCVLQAVTHYKLKTKTNIFSNSTAPGWMPISLDKHISTGRPVILAWVASAASCRPC